MSTARVLQLLGLLQSRPVWTGTELAERLSVTTRCIRRDIERLRELGYAVDSARGAGGGYHLSAGKPVPPLLLDDDEAVAVAVCLLTGAGATSAVLDDAAVRALLKLDQTLPARLRAKVRAVQESTVILEHADAGIDPYRLQALTGAAAAHQLVRFAYRTLHGVESQRRVEPYRLIAAGRRWYLMAFDLDRDDWRTFRIDRMAEAEVSTFRYRPRPMPDPKAYLADAFTRGGYEHTVTVLVNAPAAAVADRIPPQRAVVEQVAAPGATAGADPWCRLTAGMNDLASGARYLATLGFELRVVGPPAFAEAMVAAGEALLRAAAGASSDAVPAARSRTSLTPGSVTP